MENCCRVLPDGYRKMKKQRLKIRKKQRNIIIAAVILTAVIIAVCVRSGVFKPKYTYSGDPYVCLDAGHGADDVGAANGKRYEKDDDLKLTLKIKEKLEAMGIKVYLKGYNLDFWLNQSDTDFWFLRTVPHVSAVTLLSFLFMLIIILLATWIPVYHASKTMPSDALHDE